MLKVVPVKISEHFEETRKLSAMHWQETESDFSDRPPELDIRTNIQKRLEILSVFFFV